MRPLLLLLACMIGSAGCDSAGPTQAAPPETPPIPAPPPVTTGPPNFTVTGLPDRLDYHAGETDQFSLTAFFEPMLPADIVVTASSPSTLVDLQAPPTRILTIKALESGSTVLTLHATATGYRDTTLTIPLTVTGSICPPRSDRDLIPARASDVWRFSYLDEDARRGAVTEGTVTFRVLRMTCATQYRNWIAHMTLDAVETSASGSRPVVVGTSVSLSEDATNKVSLLFGSFQNLYNSANFQRFWTGPGDTAVLTTSTSCVGLETPPAAATMTFEVGVGLVAETTSCGSGPTLHRRQLVRLP